MLTLDYTQTQTLIIDYQTGLIPHLEGGKQALITARKVAALSRIFDLPLTLSEQAPAKLGSTHPDLAAELSHCARFEKIHFSCMQDPALASRFAALKRHQVLVAGVETHICLYLTVRDMALAGYKPIVVADSAASRNAAHHETALQDLRAAGITVLPFETVAYDLLGQAATPRFKQLLPLFK